jgi:hypothetical protein
MLDPWREGRVLKDKNRKSVVASRQQEEERLGSQRKR